MSDIDLGPVLVVYAVGFLFLGAQLGAIPVALAAIRRFRDRAVTAALGGWLLGTIMVPLGWLVAELLRRGLALPLSVYPYYWVVGILPAWFLAATWYRAGARGRDAPQSP